MVSGFYPRSLRAPLLLAIVLALSLSAVAAFAGRLPDPSASLSTLPTPPANDDFANATVITSLPFTDVIDNTSATVQLDEPMYCYWLDNSVWYTFTPATNMWVHVDMAGGMSDVVLVGYSAFGPGIGGLNMISCGAWGPIMEFEAQAGVAYYFQVGSINSRGTLQINVSQPLPPANDNFNAATVIASLPFSESTDNRYATREAGEPTSSCAGSSLKTLWWVHTPSATETLTLWADSWYPKSIAVYTGSSVDALTESACWPAF